MTRRYLWTGSLYFIAAVTFLAVLAALRSHNGTSRVVLSDVRTSSISMHVGGDDNISPLINETAPSRAATIRGFEATYVEKGLQPERTRTYVIPTAARPLTLHRLDQLHIKDVVLKPGTKVIIGVEHQRLDLMFDGDPDCCWARIGIGESVGMSAGNYATTHVEKHLIDPASPNLLLDCAASPCSISLDLLDDTLQGFIESRPVGNVSFYKPGTATASADSLGESGIAGGSFEIMASDLLGNEFALRNISLVSGDGVTLEQRSGRISVDVYDKALIINSVSDHVTTLLYRLRAGVDRDLLPSLLELVLREPWRPTLFAMIMSLFPLLAQFAKDRSGARHRQK